MLSSHAASPSSPLESSAYAITGSHSSVSASSLKLCSSPSSGWTLSACNRVTCSSNSSITGQSIGTHSPIVNRPLTASTNCSPRTASSPSLIPLMMWQISNMSSQVALVAFTRWSSMSGSIIISTVLINTRSLCAPTLEAFMAYCFAVLIWVVVSYTNPRLPALGAEMKSSQSILLMVPNVCVC